MSDFNRSVEDIRYGSVFDYDLKHWKVVGEYNYKWKDGTFSREFKISSKGDTRYLEVEDQEDQLRVLVFKKIRVSSIQGNVRFQMMNQNIVPQTLTHNYTNYYLKEETSGSYRDIYGDNVWEDFDVWDYYDESKTQILSIERWEGDDFEAAVGKTVDPSEFTNISAGKKPPVFKGSGNWGSYLFWIMFGLFFVSQFSICRSDSSSGGQSQYVYNKEEGLNKVVTSLLNVPDYTILLNDMDYQNGRYFHKYEVITPLSSDSVSTELTYWEEISPQFFQEHKNNMGLEVASKKDGQVNFLVSPPGFSEYVGNDKYGSWEQEGGNRVWAFYPRFFYLRNVFFNGYRRPMYNSWNAYDASARGRSNFYGVNRYYSTNNYLKSSFGRNSKWGKLAPNIRQQAEEEYSSGGGSGRVHRSGNRYSNRSSRSRSGGFGK